MTYPSVLANLAFHVNSTENVEKIIDGWKLSNDEANTLRWMFANRESDFTVREWKAAIVNGASKEDVIALLNRQGLGDSITTDTIRDWEIPLFPVTGQDLINAGIQPGPEMGRILRRMKEDWVSDQFRSTLDFYMDSMENFRD